MDRIAASLKVLGHPDRLRILALLSQGELTVSELVQILDLSQPRVTQYIKSLEDAGIVERMREGSWVFSRLQRGNVGLTAIVAATLSALPQSDAQLKRDSARLDDVRAERSRQADAFFASVANDTGQLGHEYLPQADIERAMLSLLPDRTFDTMVDLGTGTGRMLQVFAKCIRRGAGIDASADMLKVARHSLANPAFEHISVQQADLTATPLADGSADLVTLHQVLHFLDHPAQAVREAARLLSPGGHLLITDFTAHERDRFHTDYAHRRLGFSDAEIGQYLRAAGLTLSSDHTIPATVETPAVRIWSAIRPTAAARRAKG